MRTTTTARVLLASLVAGFIADSAQGAVKSIRATVPPEQETLVAFETFPNAVCTLTGPNKTGRVGTHKFYANEAGIVRFHVTPPTDSNQTFNVTLPCVAGSQSEFIPVVLRASSTPTGDMPAPHIDFADRALQALGTPRPALAGDPTTIPQEELLSMGYPPRPDPVKEPHHYDLWLRLASLPVTIIRPKLPPQTRHEPFRTVMNRDSWAGYSVGSTFACDIYFSCSFFTSIFADWWVPRVWTPSTGTEGITGVWVGLDGAKSHDILQTGTASEADQHCIWFICWGVTSYWSWTEWYPNPPHDTGIPVNPGDWIVGEAWYPGSGSNGYLYLHNITQGYASTFPEPMPTAKGVTFFSGDTAEWILERNTFDWGSHPLAPFRWATMEDAYAYDRGSINEYAVSSSDVQYTMQPNSWNPYRVYPVLTGNSSFYWTCGIASWGGDKPC
jgi:hypothetical protein